MNDDTKLGSSWYKDYIEKIKSLEQEVDRLKEENLKLRCCENCIHYDMVTECELTAITCTNYNKWEIRK